jgi:hypothetical protein
MQKDNHLDARPKEVGPLGPTIQALAKIFTLLNGQTFRVNLFQSNNRADIRLYLGLVPTDTVDALEKLLQSPDFPGDSFEVLKLNRNWDYIDINLKW